jgi:hypothetical protein
VHGRLKVADQEIRSLRSQARGITTTRWTWYIDLRLIKWI